MWWEKPAGVPGWAVLGMVQAVVGDTQPKVLWAPASVPQRAMLWWRHNCTDPGLASSTDISGEPGCRTASSDYLEQVTSAVSSCAGTG